MNPRVILKRAGFSEKEIEVYLALLANGASVASDIASAAGINRSTTYVILEALMKRGLVTTMDDAGATTFTAGDPETLVTYFENAADHFSRLADDARAILPSLRRNTPTAEEHPDASTFGAVLTSLGKMRNEKPARIEHHPLHKPAVKGI